MLKNRIREIVGDKFKIERPAQADHGDYAFFAGRKRDQLKDAVARSDLVEHTEVKNGFVNIFLKPDVWREELKQILELRETYAHLAIGEERTVNIEFISANPTGELHVGNGRGAFFGDALANIFEKAGYNVEREYYVNDAKNSLQIQELGKTALGQGDSYKTPYLEKIIAELKPKLKNVSDPGAAGYLVAQKITGDIKSFVTDELKIRIDHWFSEEELYGRKEFDSVKEKLPTYEKDGALWVKTSELGDDEDRVLVRSDGTAGYFLSDIAYHLDKAKRSDILVDIWGADHQGHVKRMYAAAKHLGFADKLRVLISQIVHVKEEGKDRKMSKRAGETVSLKWLVDEVGLDAARFFYLSKSLSTHMDFDIALAREQSQKNPVYYVQYSFARSHQIFAKVADQRGLDADSADLSLLEERSEIALIKKLAEYPEVIETIVTGHQSPAAGRYEYDVQKLTSYAYELSALYHRFYETNRVLVEDENLRNARLALVRAYQIVLKDCLMLLGINAPEKM